MFVLVFDVWSEWITPSVGYQILKMTMRSLSEIREKSRFNFWKLYHILKQVFTSLYI